MDRREFTKTLASASIGAGALQEVLCPLASSGNPQNEVAKCSFELSVTIWMVFRDLPFEERIEKIASAGYRSVQLDKEFLAWSEDDFRRVNVKRRSLGVTFDSITGSERSLVDPGQRQVFLAD